MFLCSAVNEIQGQRHEQIMKAAWFALFTVYWWYFNANVWAAVYRSEVVDSIQVKVVWKWFDACPSRKLSLLSMHKHTHTHTHLKETKPYLDRMVMKVCDHDLILVVHGHKVRTCKQQERHTQHESWVIQSLYEMREEVPHYLWTWEGKEKKKKENRHTERSERGSRCVDVGRVCGTWTQPMQRHTQETVQKIFNIHGGVNYLLKTGPDLLSFCSSAMFAPLFSKRKEKVHVRDLKKKKNKQERFHWNCFIAAMRQTAPCVWEAGGRGGHISRRDGRTPQHLMH